MEMLIVTSLISGPFSIAMFDYQRITTFSEGVCPSGNSVATPVNHPSVPAQSHDRHAQTEALAHPHQCCRSSETPLGPNSLGVTNQKISKKSSLIDFVYHTISNHLTHSNSAVSFVGFGDAIRHVHSHANGVS